jgi:hypothetical protein
MRAHPWFSTAWAVCVTLAATRAHTGGCVQLPEPLPPPSSHHPTRSDLTKLVGMYNRWAKELFPRGHHADTLDRMSGWGGKGGIRTTMETLRRQVEVPRALGMKPDTARFKAMAAEAIAATEAAAAARKEGRKRRLGEGTGEGEDEDDLTRRIGRRGGEEEDGGPDEAEEDGDYERGRAGEGAGEGEGEDKEKRPAGSGRARAPLVDIFPATQEEAEGGEEEMDFGPPPPARPPVPYTEEGGGGEDEEAAAAAREMDDDDF